MKTEQLQNENDLGGVLQNSYEQPEEN